MALPELDDASKARQRVVAALDAGSHIHLLGICGTGMSAVAALLKDLGFRVTGSDKAFYPPMGEVVSKVASEVFEGYSEKNLSKRPALVVVGNSISRGNVEFEHVLAESIPYASMPEVFGALLIGDRASCAKSIVVAGTHGKTTTTALISTMLDRTGMKPGYFIGGVPADLPSGIRSVDKTRAPQDRVVILEGDEYDSACFAKWPKFHSYRPDLLVLTSLEFDHGDIYCSVEEIELEFARLIARVPADGAIILSDGYKSLLNSIKLAKEHATVKAPIYLYGESPLAPFRLLSRSTVGGHQALSLDLNGEEIAVTTPLSGPHNALNFVAAGAVGKLLGLGKEQIIAGLESFHGVLRRQSVIYSSDQLTVIEDFAHHPTAVDLTLRGLHEAYPQKRLIAVFEPRSNTSRRGFFQKEYEASFSAADEVVIKEVTDQVVYSNTDASFTPMDVKKLVASLNSAGKKATSFAEVSEIFDYLMARERKNDLIVLMSNGDFGGLPGRLTEALKKGS